MAWCFVRIVASGLFNTKIKSKYINYPLNLIAVRRMELHYVE